MAYRGRPMLFGRYTLVRPEGESLRAWLKEIDGIYGSLRARDLPALKGLMSRERSQRYLGDINSVLSQPLDETDRRLLAIGLFFLKHKPAYRGRFKGYSKLLVGGTFTMESSFYENGDPNCIDSAYLFKELAGRYGIRGSVRGVSLRPYPPRHKYFVTNDGRVLDVMVKPGIKRLGLFRLEGDYLAKLRRLRGGGLYRE